MRLRKCECVFSAIRLAPPEEVAWEDTGGGNDIAGDVVDCNVGDEKRESEKVELVAVVLFREDDEK